MIEVTDLHKTFPGPEPVHAVRGVSFRAEPGQVFGLLGANGAGKSTTLRMIVTLLQADRGTIRVAGHDVATDPGAVRRSVGFLSVDTTLYDLLTPRELLVQFSHLQGVAAPRRRADELIERFGISDFASQRCGRLSTGMKQKVNIARALVHDPPVLILDEPTVGLDIVVAQIFLRFVEQSREEGRCVVYSTHIMSEVERLCDRVAFLHRGALVGEDTVAGWTTRDGSVQDAFLRLVEAEE